MVKISCSFKNSFLLVSKGCQLRILCESNPVQTQQLHGFFFLGGGDNTSVVLSFVGLSICFAILN